MRRLLVIDGVYPPLGHIKNLQIPHFLGQISGKYCQDMGVPFLPITQRGKRVHAKASEVSVVVDFAYGDKVFNWDIPIEYRRTGTFLADKSDEEVYEYLEKVYEACNPANWPEFRKEQEVFWKNKGAKVTKGFFDVLISSFEWKSVKHDFPPNPNWARRIQDIKEFGFTLATRTSMPEKRGNLSSTHILLLPIPRGGVSGYETWTPELKNRIIKLLGSKDVFEDRTVKKEMLIPDHKFPEVRWDEDTQRDHLVDLTDQELLNDFQLLNNQRNLQKREICRQCSQTGVRGKVIGINHFYEGGEKWDPNIPKRGKESEKGCVGCGWYDLALWRKSLNEY